MKPVFKHYTIGDFINQPANPTGFEITLFGEMDEPDVDELHKHTFYEIIWVEEGASRQLIDYNEYRMSCGSLFFISPGQVHRFEEWQQVKGGSLMFTGDFFLMNKMNSDQLFELIFLDNIYFRPDLEPTKSEFTEIKQTIELMIAEKGRPNPSKIILQAYLHVLVAQIKRCIEQRTEKPVSRTYLLLYKNFQQLVERHFAKNEPPAFYATHLNITPHHLNLVAKAITGQTATDVIRNRSLLEARRLLTFTGLSVSEIAAHLNYFDSSYFARLFKAAAGLSPLAFRNASR
ncbi:MAG: AraC family transcriptional regulator [Mucilaginibacter sp.]